MCADQPIIKKIKLDEGNVGMVATPVPEKTCAHWVKRKRRFCKMTVVRGRDYCGEHEPVTPTSAGQLSNEGDRIPCPLDSKHTVYKRNLQRHLRICNARQREDLPEYIVKNINAGDDDDDDASGNEYDNIKLNELDEKELFDIIGKVRELYGKYVNGQISGMREQHRSLEEVLNDAEYGKESRKHLLQTSALLGILEKEQQLQKSTSFVEFGAGKGQLTFYLAQLLQNLENCQVVLLDRMSLRHKKDNKIEDRSLIQRVRADIADFCMDKFPLLQNTKRCVAVSKHLCGAATDLSLRCITKSSSSVVDFILIALCCHHRCTWHSFVGKEFFTDHGVAPRQFVIITKMVSWAICGTGMSRERRRALEEQQLKPEDIYESNSTQRLSLAERENIGFMCKRVLDYARLRFLRLHGYEASLNYYVPREVTLENVCLLAKRKIQQSVKCL